MDDVAGASATLSTVDEITGNSFNFFRKTFEGTGGSTVDMPKPGSLFKVILNIFFQDMLAILSSEGRFNVMKEIVLIHHYTKNPDDQCCYATMFIPAYTFQPKNVTIKRERHQRFTMKDIGKLARRLIMLNTILH